MKFKLSSLLARVVGGGWVLDFTRLMLISTQVEVVVEVGVELGNTNFLITIITLCYYHNVFSSITLVYIKIILVLL